MTRKRYNRELLEAMKPVMSVLVAEVMGHGLDSNGNKMTCHDGRLEAVPGTVEIIARWSRDCVMEGLE